MRNKLDGLRWKNVKGTPATQEKEELQTGQTEML